MSAEPRAFAERIASLLCARKGLLLALVTLNGFVVHWLFLGFASWDGLTYRLPPVVELVQSGHLGLAKYPQWAFAGFVPFVELTNYPFLLLFKLRGLLIGAPLVVFPLSVWAVHTFVREVTQSERAGVLGGLTFAALPFVNQQPFSGYVDFAVAATLAYFLYAGLRLGADERARLKFGRFALATLLFTMARATGVYLATLLMPLLLGLTCAVGARTRHRQPVANEARAPRVRRGLGSIARCAGVALLRLR